MKTFKKYFSILFIAVFAIVSCEEAPEGIQETLFTDEESGGNSSIQLSFSPYLSYDTGRNFVANWNELVGIDISVSNFNDDSISDLSIIITGVSNTSYITEVSPSTDPAVLSYLGPFDTNLPTFYWCFDCNTTSEVRIGNTYVVTNAASFGSVNVTVDFRATFTYDGNGRIYTQDFTYDLSVF